MPIATDGEREADTDNPKGYYEWEEIKQIAKKPKLLDEEGLDQKAIKAVTMLLPHMPQRHKYKVVFMLRISRAGGIICPASPGFYLRPTTIEELVDFVVGKLCDLVGVSHELQTRWDPKMSIRSKDADEACS